MNQPAIRHQPRHCVPRETIARVSSHLTETYQLLEQRVAELKRQLVLAHQARSEHVSENIRLAKQLKQLINALPAGVILLDGRGHIRECNALAIDLLGQPLLDAEWRTVIDRAFLPCAADMHEAVLRDGRLLSISTCPLGAEPGQIVLLSDVTAVHHLQEHVNRHRRLLAMGEMAASLAHQIRTPLASALLYAAHLKRNDLAEEKRQQLVDRFVSRLRDLEQLVTDMLVFAKGEGQIKELLVVPELLDDVQASLAAHLVDRDCRLIVGIEGNGLTIQANRSALLNVLQNLVVNAIEACPEDGRVKLVARSLAAESGNPAVEFQVIDNGTGIAHEEQARIFEPFYTTRPQGTGLGLAVVRAVVEAHHGSIVLESQHGQGTIVTIRLPLMTDCIEKQELNQEGL